MYFKHISTRFLHLSRNLCADKNALASLRKKTGYTFANCRKALEMHENDLAKVRTK
jgi:elongation factor Ts